jgi:hypothetical protein
MHTSDVTTADLASLAYEFGPFLFAIVYITGLTTYAQRVYAGAQNPEQVTTFRRYFLISFIFGLVLVLISVGYWVFDRLEQHEFAYVVDVQDTPKGVAFYGSNVWITQPHDPDPAHPFETVHIVFIRDTRLLPTDRLVIQKAENGGGLGPAPLDQLQWKPVHIKPTAPKMQIEYADLK